MKYTNQKKTTHLLYLRKDYAAIRYLLNIRILNNLVIQIPTVLFNYGKYFSLFITGVFTQTITFFYQDNNEDLPRTSFCENWLFLYTDKASSDTKLTSLLSSALYIVFRLRRLFLRSLLLCLLAHKTSELLKQDRLGLVQ